MTKKRLNFVLAILFFITIISGCAKRTNDAKETFKYWSGSEVSNDIELLKGKYYESSHFTKEYIMYLKFKPTRKWWREYLNYNAISVDKNNWTIPDDAPSWFKPSESSIRYWRKNDFDQGSRYFCDTVTWICYIYEIQL